MEQVAVILASAANLAASIFAITLMMIAFMLVADLTEYRRSVVWPIMKERTGCQPKVGPFTFWNLFGVYREYIRFSKMGTDEELQREAAKFNRKFRFTSTMVALALLVLFWTVVIQQGLRALNQESSGSSSGALGSLSIRLRQGFGGQASS